MQNSTFKALLIQRRSKGRAEGAARPLRQSRGRQKIKIGVIRGIRNLSFWGRWNCSPPLVPRTHAMQLN